MVGLILILLEFMMIERNYNLSDREYIVVDKMMNRNKYDIKKTAFKIGK